MLLLHLPMKSSLACTGEPEGPHSVHAAFQHWLWQRLWPQHARGWCAGEAAFPSHFACLAACPKIATHLRHMQLSFAQPSLGCKPAAIVASSILRSVSMSTFLFGGELERFCCLAYQLPWRCLSTIADWLFSFVLRPRFALLVGMARLCCTASLPSTTQSLQSRTPWPSARSAVHEAHSKSLTLPPQRFACLLPVNAQLCAQSALPCCLPMLSSLSGWAFSGD